MFFVGAIVKSNSFNSILSKGTPGFELVKRPVGIIKETGKQYTIKRQSEVARVVVRKDELSKIVNTDDDIDCIGFFAFCEDDQADTILKECFKQLNAVVSRRSIASTEMLQMIQKEVAKGGRG